jgi:hypothetical protein
MCDHPTSETHSGTRAAHTSTNLMLSRASISVHILMHQPKNAIEAISQTHALILEREVACSQPCEMGSRQAVCVVTHLQDTTLQSVPVYHFPDTCFPASPLLPAVPNKSCHPREAV